MSQPIPLKIFIRPERRFIAEGRPTELIVLVRLLPTSPPEEVEPLPVNLGLLIDRSASMTGDKLIAAKDGARKLVESLGPQDRVSITTCGDYVETILPSTLVQDVAGIHRVIDGIAPGGLSALFPGWLASAYEVSRHYSRHQLNRVVLVSDGMANVGAISSEKVIDAARGLFRRGVSTTTIGVGDDFHEDALVPVAVQGGGNAVFCPNPDDVGERMLAEIRGIRAIFSEWATLRFDLEHAEIVDVLNEFPWIGERKVALPPLYGGMPLNVVVRLRLRPGTAGSDISPLMARVKSLDLQARQAVVHKKAMKVHVVSDALADSMGPDLGVQAQAARLEFARMHQKCVRRLDDGDLTGARQLLDFSLSRFQTLSGQSGGTLLTEDLAAMMRLRERLLNEDEKARNRKIFKFSAVFAQRSGIQRPSFG